MEPTAAGAIWLHAVSVGEVITAAGLIARLREAMPGTPMFVSVTTVAGRDVASQKLAGLADGIFYAPIDCVFAVRRVLRRLRPQMVVVLETEIWPNLYREAKRFGCALLVANGRISDRAFPRYLRIRWFLRAPLSRPDRILAQSERDRARYLELGAPADRVFDGGNLKYDTPREPAAPPRAVARLMQTLRPEAVWIAASTMPPQEPDDADEDDLVIHVFESLRARHPGLLMILAPRRPERFDEAAAKLEARSIPFVRRSSLDDSTGMDLPGVLLLDTIGELSSVFALGDVVFMGGSIASRGGHNILEPAVCARAIIAGPHMENFTEIAAEFTASGALFRVQDGHGLAEAIQVMLVDADRRRGYGERARRQADLRRGAADQAVAQIRRLYDRAVPCRRPLFWIPLWALSQVWRAGGLFLGKWSESRVQRLATPVLSIGGISVGGAGKTPFTLWLAARLKQAGQRPAILTRGYRRRSHQPVLIYNAGDLAPTEATGDEAQILLRAALAPVGIGADRLTAGRRLEERLSPGMFLLDDGFQHRSLGRDVDIVLLDVLDPFGGGALVPLGRLREPVEALRRAGIIVLTRTEPGRGYTGIIAEVRRVNPDAPIFRSRVVVRAWKPTAPPDRVAAFCGLANPDTFWRTLTGLEVKPVDRWTFPDHHRYRHDQIRRMAARARTLRAGALVTTEKDLMNLPERFEEALEGMPLHWLEIDLAVEDEDGLLRLVVAERGAARS